MSIIFVPYHLDEHLPDLSVPLPDGLDVATVSETLPPGGVWERLGHLYEPVATRVATAAADEAVPTVISGDCMVSLATLTGLQRAGVDAAVVWFDAHGDVQTLETTESGYLGGMPLRIIVGYRPELIADRLGLRPLAEDRAVLVDARDLDPAEAEYLANAAIKRCDVDELSAEQLPAGPLMVHIDLDVIDPADLPGLLFPADGGPSADAVVAAVRRVLDTGRVAALSIGCTWHPDGAPANPTRERVMSALTGGT